MAATGPGTGAARLEALERDAAEARGRSLVRGGLLLIVAKLVHVLAGFVLYFLLLLLFTRSLGEVAGTAAFGVFGTTFGVVNPINMMFATGALQMVSRLAASRGPAFAGLFARCARAQLVLAAVGFAAFQALAPWIAEAWLRDPSYVPYLRVAGLVPACYGLRALYQGYLNGVHRFREQALIDIGASLLRVGLVVAGAALGLGALGAVAGFGAAAAVALAATALWIRPGRAEPAAPLPARELYAFQGQVMLAALATYYLTSLDLLAVKAFASPDPIVADRLAGYFTASQKLAQVPMSLVVALVYVLFPFIARESGAADPSEAARLLRQGMRAMLLLLVPCTAILASSAHETLLLVFPSLARSMAQAGDSVSVVSDPFRYLVIGYVFYSLLLTTSTLVTASGRPGAALVVVVATLLLGRVATWQGTLALGPSGAALGIGAAWAVGFVGCGWLLYARFRALVAARSTLRILACGATTALVSLSFRVEGPALLAKDAGLAVLFVLLTLVTREISPAELTAALRLAGPRRGSLS